VKILVNYEQFSDEELKFKLKILAKSDERYTLIENVLKARGVKIE
jgi:hypothetical protein